MALDYIDFANQQRPTVDLGGIIAKALQVRQQTDAAAQDKQLNDLRMQGEQMKLADLMRTRQQEADLRNKIASAQPTVTQTPNPAYADWQQGTNRLADLTQQYEKAPVTGMDQNDYNSLAALSAKYSGAAPDTTLPVSTPPDYASIIKQHALQNGDYGTYQKIAQDEQKTRVGNSSAMLDTFTKLETAVKDGTMKPEDANALFTHFDTLHGSPLKNAGANVTFSSGGAYYSGPVKDTDLVSVNGRLQPLGQAGIATDFKVVGQGPNGETIYQMDKSSKFAESKPDQMAMLLKRDELQSARDERNRAAADARLERTISAADRRSERKANGPGKVLPAGQVETIADMKKVKDVLADAGKFATENKVDTGPVTGRVGSVASKVGLASDKFVNLRQKLATAQNIMLKLRSGAAVTDQEFARFQQEYPNVNDPPEVMQRKLQNTVDYATNLMNEKLDIYEEAGYKVPRSTATSRPAQTTGKGPRPGTVEGGYRFKGGDPANPASWVKVGK